MLRYNLGSGFPERWDLNLIRMTTSANKLINGKQRTIVLDVDDYNISHEDAGVVCLMRLKRISKIRLSAEEKGTIFCE